MYLARKWIFYISGEKHKSNVSITEPHVRSDNCAIAVITNNEQSTCVKAVEPHVTSDDYDIATHPDSPHALSLLSLSLQMTMK